MKWPFTELVIRKSRDRFHGSGKELSEMELNALSDWLTEGSMVRFGSSQFGILLFLNWETTIAAGYHPNRNPYQRNSGFNKPARTVRVLSQ